ncbi:hypothetical protein V8E53_002737, partial [Lactarius tabidus]
VQRHGHIGDFDIIDDHRSGKIVVQLNGRLNKAGVISPRFNVRRPRPVFLTMKRHVAKMLEERSLAMCT